MTRRSRFLSFGLLTFVAAAILFFPARVAYQWLAPAEFKLSGIHGTIWNGDASEASVGGIYLRDLQWQMQPLDLLGASLAYAIQAKFASGFLQAGIAIGPSGTLTVKDLGAALPLSELQPLIGIPGLRGDLSLQFDRLQINGTLPVAADGKVSIAGLVVPFLLREPLGDFRAEFFTEDETIIASVEDSAALLDLAGTLQIYADRSYQLRGQLAATEKTPANLRQYMAAGLGPANARGQHEFGLEGIL